jgi:hypothetical protein
MYAYTVRTARNATFLMLGAVLLSGSLPAQSPAPAAPLPAPQGVPNQDINLQFLAEVLRSATAFHDVVRSLQLEKRFGPQSQAPADPSDPDRQRRDLERTAEIMGAGAGAGVAIGGMTHSEKGLLIGALAGTAGGLLIDQILRHREAKQAANPPPPELPKGGERFQTRGR